MSADDTITIITTIYPAKNGKRAITVAGAPDGAAPRFALGTFAERHTLFDAAYAEVLKRAGKAEKKAAKPKPNGQVGKSKKRKGKKSVAYELKTEADQVGPEAPATEEPADLPVIEGDDAADSDGQEQLELTLEDSDE